jgi:hypothetical protein
MTDIKALWQRQAIEEKEMISLPEIQSRARAYETRAHRRNVVLYAYSVFNIVVSIWIIASGYLEAYRYPMVLMIAAHLFVLYQVNRRVGARPLPRDLAGRTALSHYRTELERQRDSLANAWLWYILPFMPALVWELAIRAMMSNPDIPAHVNRNVIVFLISGAVFFWTAVWLAFSRAALKVELQLERLKRIEAE